MTTKIKKENVQSSQSQGVRCLSCMPLSVFSLALCLREYRVQIWLDKKLHYGTEVLHTRGCTIHINNTRSNRSDGVRVPLWIFLSGEQRLPTSIYPLRRAMSRAANWTEGYILPVSTTQVWTEGYIFLSGEQRLPIQISPMRRAMSRERSNSLMPYCGHVFWEVYWELLKQMYMA